MSYLYKNEGQTIDLPQLGSGFAARLTVVMVLLSAVALSAGCGSAGKRSDAAAMPFTPPEGSDASLINAVLDDLVTSNVFRLGGPRDPTRYQLILHIQSRMPTSMLTTKKIRSEARLSQVKVTTQVCDDLVERNTKSVSLADFRPRSRSVVVHDMSGVDATRRYLAVQQFKAEFPNARGFVVTWMPGYSQDGATAIVRFRCGPPRDQDNAAGQVGTYLFHRQNDHWEIKWRMFQPV